MKKCFFTGILFLLPILITYMIVTFLLRVLTEPFEKLVSFLLHYLGLFQDGFGIFSQKEIIVVISRLLILVGIVCTIFFVGIFAKKTLFQTLFRRLEGAVQRIPLIGSIFRLSRQATDSFLSPRVSSYNLPAYVPYPTPQDKAMGLVMNEFRSDLLGTKDEEFSCVLVPCTPNITSGILCLIPKADVTYIDMSANEAFTFVMSFGGTMNSTSFVKPR